MTSLNYPRLKFRCPYCQETSFIPDIRDQADGFYETENQPPTNDKT